MSNSRQSSSSRTTEIRHAALTMDGLMRDTVAMERIAGALEVIGDALTQQANLDQQRFEIENPIKPERKPVTVTVARYRNEKDEEHAPIPIEDEVEIDKTSGKAKVKRNSRF